LNVGYVVVAIDGLEVEGCIDGNKVEGCVEYEGSMVGMIEVGTTVGANDGIRVGNAEGTTVGFTVGVSGLKKYNFLSVPPITI